MYFYNFYELNIIIFGKGRYYTENNFCNAFPGCVFVILQSLKRLHFTFLYLLTPKGPVCRYTLFFPLQEARFS